jgi:hypothetical protein
MRSFNPTPHALQRPLLQPVLRFFDVRQRTGVCLAGIRAFLEAAQPVGNDGKQYLVRNSIHAISILVYRAILKSYVRWHRDPALNIVGMVRAASARLVNNGYFQRVVRWIYLVLIKCAHVISFSLAGFKGSRLTRHSSGRRKRRSLNSSVSRHQYSMTATS